MKSKLELYHQDIEAIFDECKEKLGYSQFTNTSKSKFEPILQECLKKSKEFIEKIYLDTEEAVNGLSVIQLHTQNLLIGFRIADELFKSSIYKMSLGYEIDSLQPYGFKTSQWTPINH